MKSLHKHIEEKLIINKDFKYEKDRSDEALKIVKQNIVLNQTKIYKPWMSNERFSKLIYDGVCDAMPNNANIGDNKDVMNAIDKFDSYNVLCRLQVLQQDTNGLAKIIEGIISTFKTEFDKVFTNLFDMRNNNNIGISYSTIYSFDLNDISILIAISNDVGWGWIGFNDENFKKL